MMAEPTLQADPSVIAQHLAHITRRWHELEQPCALELVFLNDQDDAQVKNVARFDPDEAGIAAAADHAAKMNAYKLNAYATVNPIDATRPIRAGRRAESADILASFFQFADADSQQAADNIRNFVGPKCTFSVTTGTVPCVRPHVYWELEEPTRNLKAWSDTQKRIASVLATDSVTDPPRIMRLAGTINWPKPKKIAKGYVPELTTLKIFSPDLRPPVAAERLYRAFSGGTAQPEASPFQIDPGAAQPIDRERLAIQAMSGEEWHNAVIRLVASYVSKGLSDAEIHALTQPLTLPGFSPEQTHSEVQTAINGARAKGFAPVETAIMAEAAARPSFNTAPLRREDLRGIAPRQWLYGSKLLRGFVSVLASPGGTGKSAWITAAALDMASGTVSLHDRPHGKLRVWVYNLEDPRDETLRKVAACLEHKRLPDDVLDNLVVSSGRDRGITMAAEVERGQIVKMPDADEIIEAIKAAKIDVLTVDPVIRSHQVNENDNKHVDFVMDLYARVASEANCAVLLVHHTRKGFVSGDADSIRGGSSMTSAARVAMTLSVMAQEDARRMNIAESERRFYVRMDNAKANLAPAPERAEWLKMVSHNIGNGSLEYPDGDNVQVVTKWEPPLPWDGLGDRIVEIFDRIERGHIDENGNATPWSNHKNAGNRWTVMAVLASFPDGDFSEAQAIGCINKWLQDGLLEEREYTRQNRTKAKGVFVKNRPQMERQDD